MVARKAAGGSGLDIVRDIKLSIGRIVSALAVLVVAAAVLTEAHAASQKVAAPKLAVAKLSPFIVVGAGFHGHENVRVTVRSDDGGCGKESDGESRGRANRSIRDAEAHELRGLLRHRAR